MTRRRLTACLLLVWLAAGCTRSHYRLRADRDAYTIVRQKALSGPQGLGSAFTVSPDPRSRFYDPTPRDRPRLPIPAPRLYAYVLPELPARDPQRFAPGRLGRQQPLTRDRVLRIPAIEAPLGSGGIQLAAALQAEPDLSRPAAGGIKVDLTLGGATETSSGDEPSAAMAHDPDRTGDMTGSVAPLGDDSGDELRVLPIPRDVWQSIPANCLTRMLEFLSVRNEYEKSWKQAPDESLRSSAPRLALEDILELAQINSRRLQTQKETLYRAALRLTLQRYDYQLKFLPGNNGTSVNFDHVRSGGVTENSLSIPSGAGLDRVLSTGGSILASFANEVVLTFNGSSGYTADVSSEMLARVTQSVFQRDIVFENLTQAERDVLYAVRDYARFRKVFFRDLATSYYQLLLTYRGIEIGSQDYFSNLRGFNQSQAEYLLAERLPRFQVDQFEQNALRSRSNLIRSCNSLEQAFDQLKLQVGIPPETPINIDLTELEKLTDRDQATVNSELIRRGRRNLLQEREKQVPDRFLLVNNAINLARRMLELPQETGHGAAGEGAAAEGPPADKPTPGVDEARLREAMIRLEVEEARLQAIASRAELQAAIRSSLEFPILGRTNDLIDTLLQLSRKNLELAGLGGQTLPGYEAEIARLQQRFDEIRQQMRAGGRNIPTSRILEAIPRLVRDATDLLAEVERLAERLHGELHAGGKLADVQDQQLLTLIDDVYQLSTDLLSAQQEGLAPINIPVDDAMLTAALARIDLLNQRGNLADSWRQIKLAGDDLRSVLNLRAGQSIRTPSGLNRPFDFTFDDSQTQVGLAFDAPLNRRAQRNAFRTALIDYQQALRNLIELEDNIKFGVRNDLRDLNLDREQYRIAVASAALAYERVISTRFQLQMPAASNVTARDFLEAQRDYTQALNAVATEHIGYVQHRIQLFLDLELLQVDDYGFWPELYDEQLPPTPVSDFPDYARHPYGYLPQRLKYSHQMRQMERIPDGQPAILRESSGPAAEPVHTE